MRLIAHRGFASIHPENTTRAVENAAAIADEIEVDVRRCASGELVVIHDRTVDRVTDRKGAVRSFTRDELETMCVLGTAEGIPTLSSVLRIVPDHVGVNVELKESDLAADALSLVNSHHPNAIVSSFSRDVLSACETLDSTIPTAYLTDAGGTNSVETAIGLGCEYLHLAKDVCTDRTVTEAHRAGVQVNAWTVDTAQQAASLATVGVDGVIADRPDVLSDLAA